MNLFAYGTLMDRQILAAVSGCRPEARPATLLDYCRYAVRGQAYPALVPSRGQSVSGIWYAGLPRHAWHALDLFEGEMYERIAVEVKSEDGQQLRAQTYLCKVAYRSLLEEEDWSYETFLHSGKARFIKGFSGFRTLE